MLEYLESITFEDILNKMLSSIADDIDKAEGSIIYDALAPTAMELAELYSNLAIMLRLSFANSSDGSYLAQRVSEHGVYRKSASNAIRKIVVTDNSGIPLEGLPIGQLFRLNDITYSIQEETSPGSYNAKANTAGIVGNKEFGQLLPVESIKNLGTAVLADVLIPGADEESDEALYNRFLEEKNSPATSGNMSDYKRWAKEVAGVGDVKVIPIWNGPGTVKVIIIDSTKRAASTELIDNVYEHIEDVRPIGATVTIVSGKEKNINVTATVTLANGYNIGQVQIAFKELLINYFSSIAFRDTYVSYARIGNLLLETPGIGDYANLLINNSTANIILLDEEIPVLGTVSLEV